jgi:chitinase
MGYRAPANPCQIPIINSNSDCKVGTAKRSVEFENRTRTTESAYVGERHPDTDAVLEMHHSKVAAHDWSSEKDSIFNAEP